MSLRKREKGSGDCVKDGPEWWKQSTKIIEFKASNRERSRLQCWLCAIKLNFVWWWGRRFSLWFFTTGFETITHKRKGMMIGYIYTWGLGVDAKRFSFLMVKNILRSFTSFNLFSLIPFKELLKKLFSFHPLSQQSIKDE